MGSDHGNSLRSKFVARFSNPGKRLSREKRRRNVHTSLDGIVHGAGVIGLLSGHVSSDAEKAGQIFG